MMKKILLAVLVLGNLAVSARDYFTRVTDAIYWAEGGPRAKYPYGVKSVRTKNPREVCYQSVRNNFQRWHEAGRPGCFIAFMGRRYCPPTAHALNKNWVKNVRHYLYE